MKQRIPFFVIGLPSCFVLPCFATGCHASNFKIATAALRPRNDTKIGTFFVYTAIFCAVSLRIVFQTFISEIAPFSRKTNQICHCEDGAFLRPTRQSLTKRFAIPKRTMVERNETEPWKEDRGSRMKLGNPCLL